MRRRSWWPAPRTRALYHRSKPGPTCLQLRIRAGRARPLVGEPLTALTDRIVRVTPADLADEILALVDGILTGPPARPRPGALATRRPAGPDHVDAAAPGAEAWVRLEATLDRWLVPTNANDRARSELVAEATGLLSRARPHDAGSETGGLDSDELDSGAPCDGDARLGPPGLGVAAVARRLHVSERQLRNLFAQAVGLSPKQFARIDRVRTVLARGPLDGLARAAGAAGYYDQPHMTAEFRRLMGVPPGAYLAGRLPSPLPCGPLG